MHANRSTAVRGSIVVALAVLAACSPSSMVDVKPPSTIVDPGVITTPSGATQLYHAAVTNFSREFAGFGASGFGNYISNVAVFTDELMLALNSSGVTLHDLRDGSTTADPFSGNSLIYSRAFAAIHQVRVQAQQAREALRRFHPGAPQAWFGRLYAMEGYAIVWLAELFCSGMPLSTVPLDAQPVPSAGLTTEELLERAVATFDTAITLSGDSARFVNFARVGKARALLQFGRFADAAAAAQAVPTAFVYASEHTSAVFSLSNWHGQDPRASQIVDGEGGNGLVWSTDPRTAAMTTPALSGSMIISAKYSRTAAGTLDPALSIVTNPARVADGLEARLIEAEADLANGGSSWLTILNTLRSTCIGTAPCAPVPGVTASSLPPLGDPGTAAARLDLLMTERAMWLYLTGHRQGDLRRMVRVYQRDPATLWPSGTYNNPGFPPFVPASRNHGRPYGADYVWGLSSTAEQGNPLFTGCQNLDP